MTEVNPNASFHCDTSEAINRNQELQALLDRKNYKHEFNDGTIMSRYLFEGKNTWFNFNKNPKYLIILDIPNSHLCIH